MQARAKGRNSKVDIGKKASLQKASLNPEREEEDAKQFVVAVSDAAQRLALDQAWLIALSHGDALKKSRCDPKRMLRYSTHCGFATNDRFTNMVSRSMDLFFEEDGCMGFDGFVKSLFYMGMERFHLPGDYQAAMEKMMSTYVKPFNIAHKKHHESDGSEPDEKILSIPEVDRILYVFDLIFERLFNRYRSVDQHTNRELTLDQNKLLDQFVEIEELKELLKDYGYFPRQVAFTDISRAAQYSCFGKIVVDPTKQGGGRYSSIDAKKDATTGPMEAVAASASDASPTDDGIAAANPLYVPGLPAEYLTDEALLDKPRFMSAMVRLAQIIYSRPESSPENYPTETSRLEAFLRTMEPIYEKQFQRTMESDCDFTEKGVPTISTNAPFYPATGPMSGFEMTINGGNFCEKRGVFCKFGEGDGALVVRSKAIGKKRITVDVPSVKPRDVEVAVEFRHGEYDIFLNRIAKLRVECSNNRWQYSRTEPPQFVTLKMEMPPHTVDEDTSAKLIKLFGAVCAFQDSFNTKLMTKAKWKALKEHCELTEAVQGGQDHDIFFMEVAEFHDGAHDLSLNFKGFLRVLSRTLLEMHGDDWREGLRFVANRRFEVQKRQVEQTSKADQSEVAIARRAIAMLERRSDIELDVFLGPIIVGVLRSQPGNISSATSGTTVSLQRHPLFSYTHVECNTQPLVLAHVAAAQSLQHLVRRLLHDSFDVCPHNPDMSTRRPAGRCWSITAPSGARIGALWDYAGGYSNIEWQPAVQEASNAKFTMCTYVEERSIEFVHGYMCYTKARDIAMLRQLLLSRGYQLTTKLYRLPGLA